MWLNKAVLLAFLSVATLGVGEGREIVSDKQSYGEK